MDEPMTERGFLVACDAATRTYAGRTSGWSPPWRDEPGPTVTALSDVSLRISQGELVGIAGPSGSGKSTLLHLLAALDVPTEGTVELAGTEVGSLSERERARIRLSTVGLVFQRFHLLPSLTAQSNVALPLVEWGLPKARRRERAVDLLERVGLGDRLTHPPSALSGGEQQRVAIARALVTDPSLIVADEPTGELDSRTGERVLALFEDLARDGRAVVIASHDEAALSRADRVVELRDGERVDG